jgi:DNA-binding transcriptional ArsR family regulator
MSERAALEAIDAKAVAAAQASALPDEMLGIIVSVFDALADPTRARILYALTGAPAGTEPERSMSVRDLAIITGVSESAVSHQLRFLRDRRLVRPRRSGNVIFYSLDDHHVAALFREAAYHADHVRAGLPDHPYP